MADSEQHRAKLQQLNRNFVRSVEEADVAWFDANLAPDFFNTNSDGSFIDRKAFLAQIARGSSFKNIREHEVLIRTLGDFGIIHARFSYQKPDGSEGAGRYTDDWQRRPLAMRFGPTDGALIGATKPFDAGSNATQS